MAPNFTRFLLGVALAALSVGALSASAAHRNDSASRYWIVVSSNRDGHDRGYSVRTDGSRLSPLLPLTRMLIPGDISGDGRVVEYHDSYSLEGYVSRANGTGLHAVRELGVLSPDGKLLAFQRSYEKDKSKNGVWIVGTNGRGLRRVSSDGRDDLGDWSPAGNALALVREVSDQRYALVVQPLRGKARVVARGSYLGSPTWSPNGRWIAYTAQRRAKDELHLVTPAGANDHRLVQGEPAAFAWSPDSTKLAVAFRDAPLTIVGIDGGARRLRLPKRLLSLNSLSWSPDGRLIAIEAGGDAGGRQIWAIGADGRALHQVTTDRASLIGWTRLAPTQPQAPRLLPSERVLDANTVATRAPVTSLSADGNRAAFSVGWTSADCDHIVVWTPEPRALTRLSARTTKCAPWFDQGEAGVELSGSRVSWRSTIGCGNNCEIVLKSATLDGHAPVALTSYAAGKFEESDVGLRGDGDLLVFNDGSRLVRVGGGHELCGFRAGFLSQKVASICTTIRSDAHAGPVSSVSAGLIAIHEPDAVAVLDAAGKLVHVFPFARDEVKAALLDGSSLVIARSGVLEVYDVATGTVGVQQPLPKGFRLTDADGGIVVLQSNAAITLMRLADGHALTLAPEPGRRLAELEETGLYHSYATPEGEGRVAFVPRAEVLRRLG